MNGQRQKEHQCSKNQIAYPGIKPSDKRFLNETYRHYDDIRHQEATNPIGRARNSTSKTQKHILEWPVLDPASKSTKNGFLDATWKGNEGIFEQNALVLANAGPHEIALRWNHFTPLL
jgi:hypothetical protein